MRTMFAVGHQNSTYTRIVIRGRPQDDRQADAAKRERAVASIPSQPEAPLPVSAPSSVH